MKTKVIFRKFEDGDVIALFPDEIGDNKGNISSYMHIGQHSAATPELIYSLSPASFSEYEPLMNELTSLGYDLEILWAGDIAKIRNEFLDLPF